MDQRVLFARNRWLPFYGQISKNGILPVTEHQPAADNQRTVFFSKIIDRIAIL